MSVLFSGREKWEEKNPEINDARRITKADAAKMM